MSFFDSFKAIFNISMDFKKLSKARRGFSSTQTIAFANVELAKNDVYNKIDFRVKSSAIVFFHHFSPH